MALRDSLTRGCSHWRILFVLNEVLMEQLSVDIVFSESKIQYIPITHCLQLGIFTPLLVSFYLKMPLKVQKKVSKVPLGVVSE